MGFAAEVGAGEPSGLESGGRLWLGWARQFARGSGFRFLKLRLRFCGGILALIIQRLDFDFDSRFRVRARVGQRERERDDVILMRLVSHAAKNISTLPDLCVSSLRRGHANLLCIVPSLTDDPRRESITHAGPSRMLICPAAVATGSEARSYAGPA